MTLRAIIVFISVGIGFLLMTQYVFVNLNPLHQEELNNMIEREEIQNNRWELLDAEIIDLVERGLILDYVNSNAYVGFGLVGLSVGSFFGALHIGIDKLFFRKFYEEPSISDSVRRSLEVSIFIGSAIVLRLSAVQPLTILGVLGLIIGLEFVFTKYVKESLEKELKESLKRIKQESNSHHSIVH